MGARCVSCCSGMRCESATTNSPPSGHSSSAAPMCSTSNGAPIWYVTQEPVENGLTIGTNEPVTLVSSGLVASYSDDELAAVCPRWVTCWLTMSGFSPRSCWSADPQPRRFEPCRWPACPLQPSIWPCSNGRGGRADSRQGQRHRDGRAARPVPHPLRMAGGPVKDLDLDAFIRQATEYEGEPDPFSGYSRFFSEITTTHPFPVRRVRELISWVSAGELDRIRSGSYVRRGQEPPVSAEFDAAFQHYRARFATLVDRAGDGISSVFDRVSTWLGGSDQGDDGI